MGTLAMTFNAFWQKWYGGDFFDQAGSVEAFINNYTTSKAATAGPEMHLSLSIVVFH